MDKCKLFGVSSGCLFAILFITPVAACADLASSYERIMSAVDNEVDNYLNAPVAGWICALYHLKQTYDTQQLYLSRDWENSNFGTIDGYYIDTSGHRKLCTVFEYNTRWTNPSSVDASIPFVSAYDYVIRCTVPSNRDFYTYYSASSAPPRYVVYCNGTITSSSSTYFAGSRSDSTGFASRPGFTSLVDVYPANYSLSQAFGTWMISNNNQPLMRVGNIPATVNYLPELDTFDISNVDAYVSGSFYNYVATNYPDYIYLVPEPVTPTESPTYDDGDIVSGIPRDWTITNPQIPTSPVLALDTPDGDITDLTPGDTFSNYTSGVGFWWALTSKILDTFDIKTLVIAVLCVGFALFALYKIGG